MDIRYLTQLNDNPTFTSPLSSNVLKLEPLTIDEIHALETTYNAGNAFPAVLRELLYIAGKSCYLFDYIGKTQDGVQQWARARILNDNDKEIPRPFYVIDVLGTTLFSFVYLDENKDDPVVYEALPEDEDEEANPDWIRSLDTALSTLIKDKLTSVLSGYGSH